jgi:uncharacterized membrane protein
VVLAIFLTTITFSLLSLIAVGSVDAEFVPLITVQCSVWLLLASLIGFILLLHSVGTRIRIDQVVARLGSDARRHFRKLPLRQPDTPDAQGSAERQWGPPTVIAHTGRNGQLVDIDQRRLLTLARRRKCRIEVTARKGDSLSKGTPVAVVYGPSAQGRPLPISSALVVSAERSLVHDPRYALRLLVDIAIRALSPAINDPTTAVRVLDEIETILRVAAPRELGEIRQASRAGEAVLTGIGWEQMVDLALLEILCCGVDQPQVIRRMVALTDDLVGDVPSDRRPAVEAYRTDIAGLDPQGLPSRAQRVMRIPDRQGLGGGPIAGRSLGEDG